MIIFLIFFFIVVVFILVRVLVSMRWGHTLKGTPSQGIILTHWHTRSHVGTIYPPWRNWTWKLEIHMDTGSARRNSTQTVTWAQIWILFFFFLKRKIFKSVQTGFRRAFFFFLSLLRPKMLAFAKAFAKNLRSNLQSLFVWNRRNCNCVKLFCTVFRSEVCG